MDNKKVNLGDLRKEGVAYPEVSADTLYSKPGAYDSVINNSYVEDQMVKDPANLLSGNINQRIARLTSLKSKDSIIRDQISNVDDIIAKELDGRGITAIGRRGLNVTRANQLNFERSTNASEIEMLRGNVDSALELQRQARIAAAKSQKERDAMAMLSDDELSWRRALDIFEKSGKINSAQNKQYAKSGRFKFDSDIDNFGQGKANNILLDVAATADAFSENVNQIRQGNYGAFADPQEVFNNAASAGINLAVPNINNNSRDYIPKIKKDSNEGTESAAADKLLADYIASNPSSS